MYQILGADGAAGDPVDLTVLKEMAADGRLGPATMVLDPVSGRSGPASEMFVGDELFPIQDPASAPSYAASEAVAPAVETSPAPAYSPVEPVATAAPPAPTSAGVVPDVSQTPAPPSQTTQTFSVTLPTYPTLATEGIPDLGARFVGLLIDALIAAPLHLLSFIPVVGIVMAPITVAYWLSRDAFFGGQSIGKRVAKTRVVRLDGQPFTWAQSALRSIVYVPILALVIPFFGIVISNALLFPCLLADLVCVLITQRRIGDFLANTQVVRAE
jgi:uncharacterized RDD family membrane protein YckC